MSQLPTIVAVCITYGRAKWLQESLACFLAQDYKGPKELLIWNTFPKQQFSGNFPNVRIVNCPHRPKSLGEARNQAIATCPDDSIIVVWDDDDIFLPAHLRTIAEHFKDNDWIWLDRQFSALGEDIREISQGSCPLFSFRKSAWNAIGGYPSLSCGEDRKLISSITEQFKGQRIRVSNEKISFVYCWGNGVYHASGEGDDDQRKAPVHERVAANLARRIKRGLEPTGKIVLTPHLKFDWSRKAQQFIGTKAVLSPKNSVCIVELGRYGDIVNILPICRHVAERFKKPHIMVSRQFADILEGVSYVEPYPVDLTYDRINEAMEIARNEFGFVLQGQIWGSNFSLERQCDAFNRESWRMLGFKHKFDNRSWVPWFDQRDEAREAIACAKLMGDKPTLVVNVTSSHSSPWKEGDKLLNWIRSRYGETLHVLDVSELRLERIYDMIGLLERSVGLVSIDTALLHLAACCQVPTVAIVNPKPWLGSAIRPCVNKFAQTDYTAVAANPKTTIQPALDVIAENAVNCKVGRLIKSFSPLEVPPERTIYHVVERHNDLHAATAEVERRNRARASWPTLYSQGVVPVHVWEYPRTAKDIGDRRGLPYLKDILKVAMDRAKPWDIIMWSNDDNHLHSLLPSLLRFYVSVYDAVGSHRCEFAHREVPAQDSNPMQIAQAASKPHMGRDLFAFTKEWLERKWEQIPDFILGASEFDLCLACMIRIEKGYESTRQNLEEIIWPCELPRGFVSHQFHHPFWNRPENTDAAPSQKHNRKLFYEWAKVYLPSLQFTPILTI